MERPMLALPQSHTPPFLPSARQLAARRPSRRSSVMPICVAGMSRSGTSMVTRLLHECGLYLGPESDLLAPSPDNPEGYWEHREFLAINTDLLNHLQGDWDVAPPGMADWRP